MNCSLPASVKVYPSKNGKTISFRNRICLSVTGRIWWNFTKKQTIVDKNVSRKIIDKSGRRVIIVGDVVLPVTYRKPHKGIPL